MSFLPDGYKVQSSKTLKVVTDHQPPTDWGLVTFRCSFLPHYINVKDFSRTALVKCYWELEHGYKELVSTPAMENGTEREQDSIDLVNSKKGWSLKKNETPFKWMFLTGTPDCFHENGKSLSPGQIIRIESKQYSEEELERFTIADIKTRQTPESFDAKIKSELKKQLWQLIGYSFMTGIRKVQLIDTDLQTGRVRIVNYRVTDEDWQRLLDLQRYSIELWKKCRSLKIKPHQYPG